MLEQQMKNSPLCFDIDLGSARRNWSADLSDLGGVWGVKRSKR